MFIGPFGVLGGRWDSPWESRTARSIGEDARAIAQSGEAVWPSTSRRPPVLAPVPLRGGEGWSSRGLLGRLVVLAKRLVAAEGSVTFGRFGRPSIIGRGKSTTAFGAEAPLGVDPGPNERGSLRVVAPSDPSSKALEWMRSEREALRVAEARSITLAALLAGEHARRVEAERRCDIMFSEIQFICARLPARRRQRPIWTRALNRSR